MTAALFGLPVQGLRMDTGRQGEKGGGLGIVLVQQDAAGMNALSSNTLQNRHGAKTICTEHCTQIKARCCLYTHTAVLTMVHADGQTLCVAHTSTICEEDVWAQLALLQDPQGQRVLVISMKAERHLRCCTR